MRKNKNKKKTDDLKLCPFFDEKCKGSDCMIFHEQFEKCTLELLAWNTFALKEALKDFDTK